ncbi:V-type ATPase assembly factor PKR1 [Colletotrichum chlorophyti]|uniref:V-type ATPase assembly factor PKR1 n=1 Tax=Colletotrichum chlorophyti TaxID=708187 RepID=A0A1Q8S101_9PEZI|nr:V-type ATPase assembly factor PKR1 [Colletotrichum chlorophyti]
MANFLTNMWESIFTPGPTPTLLYATNATFGALQFLLAVLLVATRSIHFVILSVLSGSLWYAINWFSRELALHAEQEAQKARLGEPHSKGKAAGTGDAHGTDGSDTEVEGAAITTRRSGAALTAKSSQVQRAEQDTELKHRAAAAAATDADAASDDKNGSTQSNVSTEDEWEQVSAHEKDK